MYLVHSICPNLIIQSFPIKNVWEEKEKSEPNSWAPQSYDFVISKRPCLTLFVETMSHTIFSFSWNTTLRCSNKFLEKKNRSIAEEYKKKIFQVLISNWNAFRRENKERKANTLIHTHIKTEIQHTHTHIYWNCIHNIQ